MGANSSQNTGKRKLFHDNLQGFLIFSLLYHLDITLNIDPRGTGEPARSKVCLINGICTGDCLGIPFEGGFFYRKPFIIFIGKDYRTNLAALPTACAFGQINKTGFLLYERSEITDTPLKLFQFRVC
jgi:hypothetical protein